MKEVYREDAVFDKQDFTVEPPEKGEYENCVFQHCDFSNADLSGFRFTGCRFTACNLSLVRLVKTVLRDTTFTDCKMLGLRFDDCHTFDLSFSFGQCTLMHSTFYGMKIPGTVFRNSQLREVDFTGCDLCRAVFDDCDLAGARFENTRLEKADLRTAVHYSIDPNSNMIKKARFSLSGVTGLLDTWDIEIGP